MPAELKALSIEYDAAAAAGDRPRMIAIFRRIKEALGSLTQDQILAAIAFLKQILGALFPPAEPQALVASLSVDEVEAEGIIDNASLWIELITLIFTWVRRLRG